MLLTTSNVYAAPVLGENVVGKGQEFYYEYKLDNRWINTYVTGRGGKIEPYQTAEDGKSWKKFRAIANPGWEFVKWVTYVQISQNAAGQNSKIDTNTWYFSDPNNDEVEFNPKQNTIRLNNGWDVIDLRKLQNHKVYMLLLDQLYIK